MGVTVRASFLIEVLVDIPGVNYLGLMMFSFVGAGLGAALVFGITSFSRGGLISVKLALAGSAT